MSTQLDSDAQIPEELHAQARELGRGAEILPEGTLGLAKKLHTAQKQGRQLRVKLGIDPTSTDLHIGHSVVFRKLRRFQEFGHQVVLIIGGFTAQIGDPSGRNTTRPPLTREQVEENAKTYLNQMGLILDLSKTELVNNADWLAPLDLNDILKLASLVTINQLLAKEAFGDRFEKQLPVSFHELFYPLLQGYDSVAVRADVELGGTDQRFNILQGRELQPHYLQDQQVALLVPLLEGTDGVKKMSKTYDNYIALKDEPSDMLGKCMRIPDDLIVKYFELATTLTGDEIDEIKNDLQGRKNPKDVKMLLGKQIVSQYHGAEKGEAAVAEWQQVHSERKLPDDIPEFTIVEPKALFRILTDINLAPSAAQAKRLIAEGGVRVDTEQVTDPNFEIGTAPGDHAVVQVGRRRFAKVRRSE
ncbi:MAG: tyrosine--tRNA ligase [Candidatus Obscuribacterales bacterium]|nr:tyrosine--tRNA ligase [Candidatus Obscuribacterales bacterium]